MGADLYIKNRNRSITTKSSTNKNSSKEKAPLNGYFRDSYNLSSVLWTLGLSWWQDVIPLLDAKCELKGEKLRHFRNQVAQAIQRFPSAQDFEKAKTKLDKTGRYSLEGMHRYYARKREQLLRFLDFALKHNLAVLCSL
jgi:hypothetical protein